MVAYHSLLTVMARGDVTIVAGSIPLWILVHPNVKRARPFKTKKAPRNRETVNSWVGTVLRVVWYKFASQEGVVNTLRSPSNVLYGKEQVQPLFYFRYYYSSYYYCCFRRALSDITQLHRGKWRVS